MDEQDSIESERNQELLSHSLRVPALVHGRNKMKLKLSLFAMVLSAAILCGGAILLRGLFHIEAASHEAAFMHMAGSVYPWYHSSPWIGNLMLRTAGGVVGGAIAALVFAVLYNVFSSYQPSSTTSK